MLVPAQRVAVVVVAAAVGALLATTIGSAGAATQVVTLGSTLGTPTQNICVAGFNCTYVPFHLNVSTPELQVPFDGTVTSFSVNSGSAIGTVELRVLRPAGNGSYSGGGTSPAESLSTPGVNTYTVSLAVKAGDVLALDNDSSAILFDTSDATYITSYYSPALADGGTVSPTNTNNGYRLLLSATVEANASTTTSGTSGTTAPTTGSPPTVRPIVTNVRQSHAAWREGSRLAKFASTSTPPVGTTFSLTLNQRVRLQFAFAQLLSGRLVKGRCVAPSPVNHAGSPCRRTGPRRILTFLANAGTRKLSFQGRISRTRRLVPGSYRLVITATNAGGLRSAPRTLNFKILTS